MTIGVDCPALIGAGLTNTEIVARLHLSMSSVKTHVSKVFARTASRDRVQAAILAIRAGLTRDRCPCARAKDVASSHDRDDQKNDRPRRA